MFQSIAVANSSSIAQACQREPSACEHMWAHPLRGADTSITSVPPVKSGGIFKVPVTINGVLNLDFFVDSGAGDAQIPADVALTLMHTGTVQDSDVLGERTYTLADGSQAPSKVFRIKSLKVGNMTLENVSASIAPANGSLPLGQSFLSRFKSWSIDNSRQAIVLE
jgi:predicted aspartyl protease